MERMISSEEGKRLADSWKASFLETSAKKNESVADIFHTLLVEIEKANGNVREKNNCILSWMTIVSASFQCLAKQKFVFLWNFSKSLCINITVSSFLTNNIFQVYINGKFSGMNLRFLFSSIIYILSQSDFLL